jgi:hypothetical protein
VKSEHISTDLAMNCYALLLQEKHPEAQIAATIYALRSNTKATHRFIEEELESFSRDLVTLGTDILDRDFDGLTPIAKPLCPTCDFLPLCKKHTEFSLS